jgi:hypothetical protein
MRRLFTICKIVGIYSLILFVGCCLYISISVGLASHAGKQYVSYTILIYDAKACDEFKERFGKWPNSLAQLQSPQMHLRNPVTNDAWGREIMFVPYNEFIGYGEVISCGHDGKLGGTGVNHDLVIRYPTEANAAWNKQQGEGLKKPARQ